MLAFLPFKDCRGRLGLARWRISSGGATLGGRRRKALRLGRRPHRFGGHHLGGRRGCGASSTQLPKGLERRRVRAWEFRRGYWLLRVDVSNEGTRDASLLSGLLAHPTTRLHAQASVVRWLAPSSKSSFTLALPLASVVSARTVDVDLLLTWRAPCQREERRLT